MIKLPYNFRSLYPMETLGRNMLWKYWYHASEIILCLFIFTNSCSYVSPWTFYSIHHRNITAFFFLVKMSSDLVVIIYYSLYSKYFSNSNAVKMQQKYIFPLPPKQIQRWSFTKLDFTQVADTLLCTKFTEDTTKITFTI